MMDLNNILLNLEKMLKRIIGEDISLKTKTGRGLPLMEADPGQIEQVIMNLVINSRDAMPAGGEIIIETSAVELNDAFFSKRGVQGEKGEYLRLTVRDNGLGISEDDLPHIFDPFFTTKEVGKGTGPGPFNGLRYR